MMTRLSSLFFLLVLPVLVVACNEEPLPTAAPTLSASEVTPTQAPAEEETPLPTATASEVAPTAVPPTATPSEPLAATVNGQPITLADYENELARYEQAQSELGITPGEGTPDYRGIVLDALIETELIAQAAAAMGLAITPEMIDARLLELEDTAGGPDNFAAWLETNQWSAEEFREALAAEMLTEETVAIVTKDVPSTTEQVSARYLQVDEPELAQSLLDQARAGADFATLARDYSLDRITGENGGDLGYFARGSLLVPEIEAAAFDLQPGEISEVIVGTRADGSGTTYYIVQVINRDPQRELAADLRFTMLQQSFEKWLAEQWVQAEVIRMVDPDA
ncbi:MAG: peptidylprolyl isomerase [Chloroflexota bacterium]|nr:MAG: peptidylprolyl isomerase [Chloroflexota bacterium]